MTLQTSLVLRLRRSIILANYLKNGNRFYLSTSTKRTLTDDATKSVARTRNIGIIAHIDAGKTTTTERMLFYSGSINSIGEVDSGDTVTDYMQQEKERGITITSASVRFDWQKHQINLIDTPGHVDFTFEVERCLSVLDSAVVILDASAGVEAQTMTVWQQAENYQIPKLVYLNKMDKPRANVDSCCDDLSQFGKSAQLVQTPLFDSANRFVGLIDVITKEKFTWSLNAGRVGQEMARSELNSKDDPSQFERMIRQREQLIAILSDHDSILADLVLSNDNLDCVSNEQLLNAVRRCTIRNQFIPITVGSSFKNIGVQPLMDSILRHLPSPLEKNAALYRETKNTKLCAFAFKVTFHPNYGPLTFVRVLSGRLSSNARIFNSARQVSERVGKVFVPFADHYKEVQSADFGSIVAVSGLTQTITGNCLVQSKEFSQELVASIQSKSDMSTCERLLLNGLKAPAPVYFCSIEAPSLSKQKDLELALDRLQKEDPSFQVHVDQDTGQMVLNGMGELHLEIIKDRIEKEYKLEPYFGQLQISYRESIDIENEHLLMEEKLIKNVRNVVTIRLKVLPCQPNEFRHPIKVKVIATADNNLHQLRSDRLHSIENGVRSALEHGPLLGFPVMDCRVELLEFICSHQTMPSFVSAVAQKCVHNAIAQCKPYLLEPIMRIELNTPEAMYGLVMRDLTNRRAVLGENVSKNRQRQLIAYTPLAELNGYSSDLRKLTSGKASLFMKLHNYVRMSSLDQEQVCKKIQGYV